MKKITIKLPTSLSEIKIGHLQHIAELESIYKHDLFKQKLNIISYLSGHSIKELGTVAREEIDAIDLSWLSISYAKKAKAIESFKLDGKKYMMQELGKESAALHADFQEMIKKPVDNAHMLVAMLYRPVIKKRFTIGAISTIEPYDVDNLFDRAVLFANKLPASIFENIIAFFLISQQTTLKAMLESLEKLMKETPDSLKKKELEEKMSQLRHLVTI